MEPDTPRRWGKAGVRLTPQQAAANDARNVRARGDRDEREAENLRVAERLWAEGLVVPHRITDALNQANLWGPEVDIACLAREPDVDLWEEAKLYPAWEQLLALAALTGKPPRWFTTPLSNALDGWNSFQWHTCQKTPEPVLRYPDHVVAACPGTVLHRVLGPGGGPHVIRPFVQET